MEKKKKKVHVRRIYRMILMFLTANATSFSALPLLISCDGQRTPSRLLSTATDGVVHGFVFPVVTTVAGCSLAVVFLQPQPSPSHTPVIGRVRNRLFVRGRAWLCGKQRRLAQVRVRASAHLRLPSLDAIQVNQSCCLQSNCASTLRSPD